MNKQNLIYEIKDCIDSLYGLDCAYFGVDGIAIATILAEQGYRKQSEVAREILEEIYKIIDKHYNMHIFSVEDLSDVEQEAVMNFSGDVTYDIAELKKKYEVDSDETN